MLIHSLFSPTCEFTRLMHSFSPSGIKLMHFYHQLLNLSGLCTFFSSPPCKLIRLMHSFCHHRVNLSSSCSCFFTTVWTYQAHALVFSPPCELIKLTHSFFTTLWTYQTHALFFSPPCELIKLLHSFFTTVRTYQTHALFFFSPPWELISLMHSFSDCWNSDLYSTHARTLWFLRNRVEGTWKYCNDENYVVQKPCLVYSFG